MSLEVNFDATFTASLALREKQIQQSYRPIIGIHKWFARRPGTVFRSLLLSEFNGSQPIDDAYWRAHRFSGTIADPFMGGGTPLVEANRLGFGVVGADINPMAHWIVRQSLAKLDLKEFASEARIVCDDVESQVGRLYNTRCLKCGDVAVVKYFLWVKASQCPECGELNDLFPGYLLAESVRHPKNVLVCAECGTLNEYDAIPTKKSPGRCTACGAVVASEGVTRRGNRVECRRCGTIYPYLNGHSGGAPEHRMWAIEYHCKRCKPGHVGRFFKAPDSDDLARFQDATNLQSTSPDLPIPTSPIPRGDETDRLHRWGYRYYSEMFNGRQLLGLGLLLERITHVADEPVRDALLTVFSDFLRYQNMLCRYDTYALKCQDIFSVHGYPVGLVQCENNLLGIPRVGSGSFRHFVEKYHRAKEYCDHPFETAQVGTRKRQVPVVGERIGAELVGSISEVASGTALLHCGSAEDLPLPSGRLDGVFTDPPYFDNVQYAELMDFCYVWLRLGLKPRYPQFESESTRTPRELTGNVTLGRGIEHFTQGLSEIFTRYAAALREGAPFVFTYHHNEASAYAPLVVAILDAGMDCTATLPAPAEMSASLHIAGTSSSTLDSVFVCRIDPSQIETRDLELLLEADLSAMKRAGVKVSRGDARCLLAGHVARTAVNRLRPIWDARLPLAEQLGLVHSMVRSLHVELGIEHLVKHVSASMAAKTEEVSPA